MPKKKKKKKKKKGKKGKKKKELIMQPVQPPQYGHNAFQAKIDAIRKLKGDIIGGKETSAEKEKPSGLFAEAKATKNHVSLSMYH